MLKRLRHKIARPAKWMQQTLGSMRALLTRGVAKREQTAEGRRQSVARARFWADVRDGQREAEAHCSHDR